MKLVVDTNVLFCFFWKGSVTQKLLMKLELFAPEYALEEINKHKKEITRKARLTEGAFQELRHDLALAVTFLPIEDYEKYLRQAARISPDPNDSDFFAVALKLKLPIWSNDAQLKKQHHVRVATTADLLSNPEFVGAVLPR